MIDSGRIASFILWGPPGVGKTTLAQIIAHRLETPFYTLSAVTSGVKDVRDVIERAQNGRFFNSASPILFIDEIHRFSKSQQDSLLGAVEKGTVTLIGATTENPSFSIISPLLSRSLLLRVHSLEQSDIERLIDRALADPRGFDGAAVIDEDARAHLAAVSGGDARRSLTSLEAAAAIAFSEAEAAGNAPAETGTEETDPAAPVRITLAHATEAVDRAAIRYDRSGDQHYDVVSAFIKSMRGSDADAAVHYLARMLEGGEDPRFVARRIMILASEDIGLADPQALQVATAAAQSVALVGMPEARIILSQAVIYCALAPKSNAAYNAINRAIADVRAGVAGQVPVHLRDGHYAGAKQFGHGVGYVYAHDEPGHVAAQQYLPDTLRGTVYYEPTQHGFERTLTERRERIRRILDAAPVQDTTR